MFMMKKYSHLVILIRHYCRVLFTILGVCVFQCVIVSTIKHRLCVSVCNCKHCLSNIACVFQYGMVSCLSDTVCIKMAYSGSHSSSQTTIQMEIVWYVFIIGIHPSFSNWVTFLANQFL